MSRPSATSPGGRRRPAGAPAEPSRPRQRSRPGRPRCRSFRREFPRSPPLPPARFVLPIPAIETSPSRSRGQACQRPPRRPGRVPDRAASGRNEPVQGPTVEQVPAEPLGGHSRNRALTARRWDRPSPVRGLSPGARVSRHACPPPSARYLELQAMARAVSAQSREKRSRHCVMSPMVTGRAHVLPPPRRPWPRDDPRAVDRPPRKLAAVNIRSRPRAA